MCGEGGEKRKGEEAGGRGFGIAYTRIGMDMGISVPAKVLSPHSHSQKHSTHLSTLLPVTVTPDGSPLVEESNSLLSG